jgi:hypothetical protein
MYTCPKCGRISHNPNDALNRYCGYCHLFEEQGLSGRAGTPELDRARIEEITAAIKEGLRALEEGRVVQHEEVKARLKSPSPPKAD